MPHWIQYFRNSNKITQLHLCEQVAKGDPQYHAPTTMLQTLPELMKLISFFYASQLQENSII